MHPVQRFVVLAGKLYMNAKNAHLNGDEDVIIIIIYYYYYYY